MPLKLEIVTPEAIVYNDSVVDEVVLTSVDGEYGILPGHRPLLTAIEAGELSVTKGSQRESLAVDRGFARVLGDMVSVVTEAAIDIKEIDLSAVDEAEKRAQEAVQQAREQKEIDPAEIERLEAVTRFAIVQRLLKKKRQG